MRPFARRLARASVAVLVLGVAVACGGDGDGGEGTTTRPTTTAPRTNAAVAMRIGDHLERRDEVWAVVTLARADGRLETEVIDDDPADGEADIRVRDPSGAALTSNLAPTRGLGVETGVDARPDGSLTVSLAAEPGRFDRVTVGRGNSDDLVVIRMHRRVNLVARARERSVLRVVADDGSFGSAWVYEAGSDTRPATIITNFHVVNGGLSFTASLDGGEEREATIAAAAPCEDLAALRVDGEGLRALALASPSRLEIGDAVFALGFPGSGADTSAYVATDGIVSALDLSLTRDGFYRWPDLARTSATINRGNSGGPLVLTTGEVVGVNSARVNTAADGGVIDEENYAISGEVLARVLPELARGRSIGWSGVWLSPSTTDAMLVTGAAAGSPAAGALPGASADAPVVLEGIDGTPVTDHLNSYCAAVFAGPAGGESGRDARYALIGTDGASTALTIRHW